MVRPTVVAPAAAVLAIVIEAVTEVALAVTMVPLMPALVDTSAEAAERFAPVNVTPSVLPAVPDAGVTDVTDGVAALTVKGTV
jgi:hypothetical protein